MAKPTPEKAPTAKNARGLPSWATISGETPGGKLIIDVDCDAAYGAMLADLGAEEPDQFWLEVAYQCIKMDLQVAAGFNVEIHMQDPGKRWAQKTAPKGRGAESALAERGREIRQHYVRLRGAMPAG